MAALIERQPSVREQYAQELVDEEVVTQEEADALAAAGGRPGSRRRTSG